ncbi:MAG TPA: hypothetical protein VN966_02605 [Candidatus Bathyarchaeia archaeon]|nr:hypothetical protein [Candidatus Bathyarchaeia archaeon]
MNPRGLTCLARGLCTVLVAFVLSGQSPIQERRFLYVAVPGIRNEVEHGGVGVLVFDIDNGHNSFGAYRLGPQPKVRRPRTSRVSLRTPAPAGFT